MNCSLRKFSRLFFAETTGIIACLLTLIVPDFYAFFAYLFGFSLGPVLFLFCVFLLYMTFTILVCKIIINWKSITCWFFSLLLSIIVFLYQIPKMRHHLNEFFWESNCRNLWIIIGIIVLSQGLLILSYIGIQYLLSHYIECVEKKVIDTFQDVGKILNRLAHTIISFFHITKDYIEAKKYLYFVICESLSFIIIYLSWFLGLNPLPLIAMIATDYAFDIIILGNTFFMSILTIFFAASLLKKSKWFIWTISLLFCLIGEWLLMRGFDISIEYFATIYNLSFLFSVFLIFSQIFLMSFYWVINLCISRISIN